MQVLKLLPVAGALLATAAAPPAEGPRTYLASIAGIALGPNEFVDQFSIDTWGVEFVAICHLPPGWEIRAGREATPIGAIAGRASHGVTFLNRPRLRELEGLALIRIHGPLQPRPVGTRPATFAGRAGIGRYGVDERRREVRLTHANVRLVPAARCPPPR